jgi:hypothetical protein
MLDFIPIFIGMKAFKDNIFHLIFLIVYESHPGIGVDY